jgi:hypothetical protein
LRADSAMCSSARSNTHCGIIPNRSPLGFRC